ncbi:amidohydrolase family protein [Alteromonas sp. CYL-A6]|uniref:amidohydrolase family protein n=1 Tax=Alteromonas nitratireducens TaxID=3390813 RepID=UPI0034A87337
MTLLKRLWVLLLLVMVTPAMAKPGASAPPRGDNEGQGPFTRLILRGGTLINGEGAPPIGPVDIIVEGNRIADIVSVGNPGVPVIEARRPKAQPGDKELDVSGKYILPGFIDMHGHIGGSADDIPAEYVFKLWLGHGITTVREPGSFNGMDWVMDHVKRSRNNTIVAPRLIAYKGFMGSNGQRISTPEAARKFVRQAKKQGAEGLKFFGAPPEIMAAALDEAGKLGMGSAMHHAQLDVMRMNVMDSAKLGLTTMEHWYGLPEAMFEDRIIQHYPSDYNYNNEQHRFAEAGRLWEQAAAPGSDTWNQVRDALISMDFTLDPTMTIYEASRDLMRERYAPWHDEYTLPTLWEFFKPSRYAHGSYWFDWTTADEVAWKHNFRLWMQFINDYKNHGGRVTTGSDSGYIYKIYGFGYIRELELLQEAGFTPLEVIQAATLNGAEALGMADKIGSVSIGKLADMVIVDYNPLQNFKVLYGTGHYRLNSDNQPVTVGGVTYTVKDGIVYDAKALLSDVRKMVADAKK